MRLCTQTSLILFHVHEQAKYTKTQKEKMNDITFISSQDDYEYQHVDQNVPWFMVKEEQKYTKVI